ncbi:uncharacterized protein LOC143773978 [Ranitomeya variabilis]|uniref:uncharacterized protein LOC143773978 n=1 Tax=Ranitomeya variabilis TaxID=490064 RepID=UPI00405633C0
MSQHQCIKRLKNLKDIVIKPADKGGNIVIWPTKLYEAEAYRLLRDTSCYKKLTYNPLSSYKEQLRKILWKAEERHIITTEVRDILLVKDPRISTLYLLPKVHKNLRVPPGRPIVSGVGGLTEGIGRYIDSFLKPLVETIPSYTRDTSDFLKKIDSIHIDEDMILATCDVESLYTNIRHQDGLRAVSHFLAMTDLSTDDSEFLLILLEFLLTKFFFLFNGSFFLQLQGTVMGAACAPSYANLFLGLWERDLFSSDRGVSMEWVIFWARYIDDIFLIWRGTPNELKFFFQNLNINDLNIHLSFNFSYHQVEFLDVLVRRGPDGLLSSDAFRKVTAVNSVLHASSSHPPHVVNAVPTGQFLRIKRICSNSLDFEARAKKMKTRFLERGYSKRSIKRAYNRARNTDRNQLLYSSNKKESTNQ